MIQKIKLFFTKYFYFKNSEDYWIKRYEKGGNSGPGSYNEIAGFKAEIINSFVKENEIIKVIEYGCGDGNQLSYFNFKYYLGFDISPKAIAMCKGRLSTDSTKEFKLIKDFKNEKAELTLSLDVIFHLVEESTFIDYMKNLFDTSLKYVIIYSTNSEKLNLINAPHVKHRNFTKWVKENRSEFQLIEKIKNNIPEKSITKSSKTNFYIYKRRKN